MKKNSVFDFFTNVLVIYGVTIIIMSLFCLILGDDAKAHSTIFSLGSAGLGVATCFQFLLMNVIIVVLKWIFFTDLLIKNWSTVVRTIGMMGLVIVLTGVFAAVFKWFPVDMPEAWISFLVCFLACTIVSAFVSVAKEKSENKKLQEALDKLKESEE